MHSGLVSNDKLGMGFGLKLNIGLYNFKPQLNSYIPMLFAHFHKNHFNNNNMFNFIRRRSIQQQKIYEKERDRKE